MAVSRPGRSGLARRLLLSALLGPALLTAACWDEDRCDPGTVIKDGICYPAPAPPPPPAKIVDSGGADGETAAKLDTFGIKCTTQNDCAAGTASVCAAPQLPYCTEINCQAGEAHAGVCPTGWQCLLVPPNPSVCLKNP